MLWSGIADNMVYELETMHCRPPKTECGGNWMTWYEICSMVNYHEWHRGLHTKLLQTGRPAVITGDYKYGYPSWWACWSIIRNTAGCCIHDDLSLVRGQSIVITNETIHHYWYCALLPQSACRENSWDLIVVTWRIVTASRQPSTVDMDDLPLETLLCMTLHYGIVVHIVYY